MSPLAALVLLPALARAAAPCKKAAPDKPFTLKVGACAVVGGTEVRLVEARDDSRCPRDVVCVWAGDATVGLSVTEKGKAARSVELHTVRPAAEPLASGGELELTKLEPAPRAGKPIAQSAYVATLVLRSSKTK